MRRERADEIAEKKRREEMARWARRRSRTSSKLTDKIKHVLTECRVVLPGAQALLGFQFIFILTESFDKLPALSKYIHLAALGLNALQSCC